MTRIPDGVLHPVQLIAQLFKSFPEGFAVFFALHNASHEIEHESSECKGGFVKEFVK